MSELVVVDHEKYGLKAEEAAKVKAVFLPMISRMDELESEFNEVLSMPIEPSTCEKAKELRLKYVKVRTGTSDIHKQAKAYYLNGGKFIDSWKNVQEFTSQGKEDKLKAIEKYFENQEKERKDKVQADREVLIIDLCDDPKMYGLRDMSEPAFDQLLNGLKLAKEQREEAERLVEEERQAKIKAEAEERARIEAENARLKAEAEEQAKARKLEQEAADKALKEEQTKADAARKAHEKQLAYEKAARERVEAEAKAATEKAEREAKAKANAEAKEQKEKEAQEHKAANAPDKQKLLKLAEEIKNFTLPELKSEESKAILKDVSTLLAKINALIVEKSATI